MRPATIAISQPCAESWAAMTPTSAGRHCAACQKTVIDFTLKSNAEILAVLALAAGGGLCGRVRTGQLDRPLRPLVSASSWRTWLSALLTVGSLGALPAFRAMAQTTPAAYSGGPTPTARPAPANPASSLPPIGLPTQALPSDLVSHLPLDDSLVLRGTVQDAATHEALPGVTVLFRNTVHGTSTNAAGEFVLAFPPGVRQGELVASSVGYQHSVRMVEAQEQPTALTITLELDTQMMGELVVYPARRPYPWHPRAFWFWLTRPFRRL